MPQLLDPELKRLRALAIIDAKIHGKTQNTIAKEFNLNVKTVVKIVDWAKREGLFEDARELVLSKLVPSAVATYATALEEGDVSAARDILFGTGVLRKDNSSIARDNPADAVLTLDAWREKRTLSLNIPAGRITAGEASPPAAGSSAGSGDGSAEGVPLDATILGATSDPD